MKTIKKYFHDDYLFSFFNSILLILFTIIIAVPVWNVVASSFATSEVIAKGNYILFPQELTLNNYRAVLKDETIFRAFIISILKTIIGMFTHVFFTALFAYPLSKHYLKGKSIYKSIGIGTMFFSGGLVPTYLLIRSLGLLDSFWVYIIPSMFTYYAAIILMNFYRDIPASLEESAMLDGASHWQIFSKIYLPLSKPALATIGMWHAVYQWNDFFTAKLYISREELYPLQMKLYEIIVNSQTRSLKDFSFDAAATTTKGVQLATIVITALPIVIIYPLFQKYFISGAMSGSIKE
ncbi:carbohydrate ABC transporter permease [Facklamia miroungae]|uniref:Putative aldouronate transport system permease protein n=1 Tax=Facklamia miroungae TaxID=120956 RepID=A0A1G7UC42_9LACT|nr:carbohydrate ABC transporter permease [Facklamia miroungae]NKZ30055.1 carbohydrate ABC transporter permease [Facklamia miroungae]SDG45156.1 putative aldouronate transport system permease protein [Facklamia miroungae]